MDKRSCHLLDRGFEALKTESVRIFQYIHYIRGMYSFFRNWSITQGHGPLRACHTIIGCGAKNLDFLQIQKSFH